MSARLEYTQPFYRDATGLSNTCDFFEDTLRHPPVQSVSEKTELCLFVRVAREPLRDRVRL